MIFEMTEKQYQLFLHVMQVMQTFYGNDFFFHLQRGR